MIPWSVEDNGKSFTVNDRGIGDALYKLLPNGFANRDRIGGIYLRARYSEVVPQHIRERWEMAGSMSSLGPTYQKMAGRFEILGSEIAAPGSIDTDSADGEGWAGKIRFPDSSIHGDISFYFHMQGTSLRKLEPSMPESIVSSSALNPYHG
jgi:hypothetical protein